MRSVGLWLGLGWCSRPQKVWECVVGGGSHYTSQWTRPIIGSVAATARAWSLASFMSKTREEGKQARPGEPSEPPDRPDDIRPWMQLNHRAHPSTPDPCQPASAVRYSVSTMPFRHPGRQTSPEAHGPVTERWGTGSRGLPADLHVRAPRTKHPACQPSIWHCDLEATLSGPLRLAHPRPPTLPFWAAALPRWASLNSPIAFTWTTGLGTLLPYLLSSASPSIPMYLVPPRPPLLGIPPHPLFHPPNLSSLTYSLACSPTPSIPSTLLLLFLPGENLSNRHVTSPLQQPRLNGTYYDRCPSPKTHPPALQGRPYAQLVRSPTHE